MNNLTIYKFIKSFIITSSQKEKIDFKGKSFIISGELPSYYICLMAYETLPILLSKEHLLKNKFTWKKQTIV